MGRQCCNGKAITTLMAQQTMSVLQPRANFDNVCDNDW